MSSGQISAKWAITAFVFSILNILILGWLSVIGWILVIPTLVVSIWQIRICHKSNLTGFVLAIIATIISSLQFLLKLIFGLLLVALYSSGAVDDYNMNKYSEDFDTIFPEEPDLIRGQQFVINEILLESYDEERLDSFEIQTGHRVFYGTDYLFITSYATTSLAQEKLAENFKRLETEHTDCYEIYGKQEQTTPSYKCGFRNIVITSSSLTYAAATRDLIEASTAEEK